MVDERGREVESGEVGEMILRGPLAQGYIGNEEETNALYRDGWYHTQDLVRMDQEGWVHFVGRKSEMLKIGGIRVYPLKIEKVLKDHPDVRDVVVVRAEERVRGEVARAVVSTVTGSGVDSRALAAYCRDRLAVYKVPRIIEFWREVPKMPNGKIDKVAVLAVHIPIRRAMSATRRMRSELRIAKDLAGWMVYHPVAALVSATPRHLWRRFAHVGGDAARWMAGGAEMREELFRIVLLHAAAPFP